MFKCFLPVFDLQNTASSYTAFTILNLQPDYKHVNCCRQGENHILQYFKKICGLFQYAVSFIISRNGIQ